MDGVELFGSSWLFTPRGGDFTKSAEHTILLEAGFIAANAPKEEYKIVPFNKGIRVITYSDGATKAMLRHAKAIAGWEIMSIQFKQYHRTEDKPDFLPVLAKAFKTAYPKIKQSRSEQVFTAGHEKSLFSWISAAEWGRWVEDRYLTDYTHIVKLRGKWARRVFHTFMMQDITPDRCYERVLWTIFPTTLPGYFADFITHREQLEPDAVAIENVSTPEERLYKAFGRLVQAKGGEYAANVLRELLDGTPVLVVE